MCEIFSASLPETAGYPKSPIPGLPDGWMVDSLGQAGLYKITHPLNLTRDELKVFVYSEYQPPLNPPLPEAYNKKVSLLTQDDTSFVVNTQECRTTRPVFYDQPAAFGFVAVLMDKSPPADEQVTDEQVTDKQVADKQMA